MALYNSVKGKLHRTDVAGKHLNFHETLEEALDKLEESGYHTHSITPTQLVFCNMNVGYCICTITSY